jgi:hypothetical protein
VALWGIETDFGRNTGGFSVIASLATLAHDGRRAAFFRRELLLALDILQQGHIAPKDMIGSWAGAMGQNQFMPSSFQAYAVDHDGDGDKDIWGSLPVGGMTKPGGGRSSCHRGSTLRWSAMSKSRFRNGKSWVYAIPTEPTCRPQTSRRGSLW